MKLRDGLLALFCTAAMSAQVQAPFYSGDKNADLKVPGNNPLYFEDNPKDYVLQLHQLDLDPCPPVPGQKLHILGIGDLTEDVDQGSFAHVKVSMGWVTLLTSDFDLCENAGAIDEECPLQNGFWNVSKEVKLPKEIPAGTYTVEIQAYTEKTMEESITRLKGDVIFKTQ